MAKRATKKPTKKPADLMTLRTAMKQSMNLTVGEFMMATAHLLELKSIATQLDDLLMKHAQLISAVGKRMGKRGSSTTAQRSRVRSKPSGAQRAR